MTQANIPGSCKAGYAADGPGSIGRVSQGDRTCRLEIGIPKYFYDCGIGIGDGTSLRRRDIPITVYIHCTVDIDVATGRQDIVASDLAVANSDSVDIRYGGVAGIHL